MCIQLHTVNDVARGKKNSLQVAIILSQATEQGKQKNIKNGKFQRRRRRHLPKAL